METLGLSAQLNREMVDLLRLRFQVSPGLLSLTVDWGLLCPRPRTPNNVLEAQVEIKFKGRYKANKASKTRIRNSQISSAHGKKGVKACERGKEGWESDTSRNHCRQGEGLTKRGDKVGNEIRLLINRGHWRR